MSTSSNLLKFSISPLSKEEEMKLGLESMQGKMAAREKLYKANIRFAVNMAKEFKGIGIEDEDLPFVASQGLWTALKNYNPGKGASVCTFSVRYIKNAIFEAANKYGERQHLTDRENRMLVQVKKALKRAQMNFKNPEEQIKEASKITGLSKTKICDLLFCSEKKVSGNSLVKSSEGSTELFDLISAKTSSPEDLALKSCMMDEIIKILFVIEKDERNVFMLANGIGYNGFGYKESAPYSISEIASHYGKSRQWAHWKLKEAKKHISSRMSDWK